MGALTTLQNASTALQAGGAAFSTVGAYYGARSQQLALEGQAEIERINARSAELAAQQELYAGQSAEISHRQKVGALKNRQIAGYAGSGVTLDSQSVQNVLNSTDYIGEVDANTIQANAVRAAFGRRVQATNFENSARMKEATASSINPLMASATTLISAATPVVTSWYKMRKESEGAPPAPKRAPMGDYLSSRNLG